MSLSEVINIMLILIALISAVSWGILYSKSRSAWANMMKLKSEYEDAIADNVISNAEKAKMADTMIAIITDASSIWQAMENLARQIIPILRKKA